MSDATKITEVTSATPKEILGITPNGICRTSLDNLFGLNPREAYYSLSAPSNEWMRVVSASGVNGGSGLLYIYRDWGTGGPIYALIGFCVFHGNGVYSEALKPQIVYAFGNLSGMKIRVVRTLSPNLYHIDIMSTNQTPVTAQVRLHLLGGCVSGGLAAPTLGANDTAHEYLLSEL